MPCRTVPAGDPSARRGDTLVGAVAGKSAAALRVQRTAWQACIPPRFLSNVPLAGEATFKAKLHRPQARTAVTVAGLFLSRTAAILPQTSAGEPTGKRCPYTSPCYATGKRQLPVE
jgi:hypothetical protein